MLVGDHGDGIVPVFTTGIEPLTRVTLYLNEKNV